MGAAHHEGMARGGERVERSSGAAPPLSSGALTVRLEPESTDCSVISLAGELDLSTIPLVEKQLLGQVRTKAAVVVDLTRVSFIDSSGIALLIQAFRADGGGTVNTVIAEGSQVERVFRLAGIDRALPLFTDRTRAVDALNGAVSG
jgi:anti-sigma B factor antagonist